MGESLFHAQTMLIESHVQQHLQSSQPMPGSSSQISAPPFPSYWPQQGLHSDLPVAGSSGVASSSQPLHCDTFSPAESSQADSAVHSPSSPTASVLAEADDGTGGEHVGADEKRRRNTAASGNVDRGAF